MTEQPDINALRRDWQALAAVCRERLRDPHCDRWDRPLLAFIAEWCNDDDSVVVHTSGSTGPPAGIRIEKRQLVNSARMTLEYLGLHEGDRALLCLPADYIAGKMMIVRSLVGNLELTAVEPQGNPLAGEIAFDFAAMIPLQVHNVLNSPGGDRKIAAIRKLIIGGAAIPAALEERLQGLENEIYSTYGMTETVSHIALRRLNGPGRSPYYTALPGVTVSTDAAGCLVIDAPAVAQNTVRTRDVVRLQNRNQFAVVGRLDNVINSGGLKYHPETIERKLEGLIAGRFIVAGVPDTRLGERIVLIVETADSRPYESASFRQAVAALLPEFERPKEVFSLVRFPETGNSKVQRQQIAGQATARPTGGA